MFTKQQKYNRQYRKTNRQRLIEYCRKWRRGLTVPKTTEQRFWEKVDRREGDECWNWTAAIDAYGYGKFWNGNHISAHRFSYELLIGPIRQKLTLDHLCRNRRCVNPTHLEQVTVRQNVLRGEGLSALNARKSQCKNGHPFTPENTYLDTRSRRVCRTCMSAYQKKYKPKLFLAA